jgi:hypothetical protein
MRKPREAPWSLRLPVALLDSIRELATAQKLTPSALARLILQRGVADLKAACYATLDLQPAPRRRRVISRGIE